MNKLQALRDVVYQYTHIADKDATAVDVARVVIALLSDPDNALVLIPRLRDAEGKATCRCGQQDADKCLALRNAGNGPYCWYNAEVGMEVRNPRSIIPLPDCPVWRGVQR